jgi:hypothetical protein
VERTKTKTVIPAKAGTQYSSARMFIIGALEYWVARSSRAMTVMMWPPA